MLLAAVALAVTTLLAPPPHRPTAAGVVRPAAARHPPVRCGVPGFVSWICETAPSASYELPEDFKASVVCFDLNAILHNQLRKARNEQHAVVLVFGTLHNVLRRVKPTDTVVLALDGPAPAAKISTQRSRRMKTSKKEGKFQDRRGVSSLVATPGTRFMRMLEDALVYFVCSELTTQRAKGIRFLVSGSDVPGEGEIKCLNALHQLEGEWQQGTQRQRRHSVVLVGSDGDLLLQALTLSPSWEVSIMRDLPKRDQRAPVVSLDQLRDSLALTSRSVSARNGREYGPASIDLIGLSALMGNDYLPKSKEVSFLRLSRAYEVLRARPEYASTALLRNEESGALGFDYSLLAAILLIASRACQLASLEMSKLMNGGMGLSEARKATVNVGLDEATMGELAAAAVADVAAAASGASELPSGAPPRLLTTAPPTTAARRYNTLSYLEGILWTVETYVDGECPDYGWEYGYDIAPSASAIASFLLQQLRARATKDIQVVISTPRSERQALPAPVVASLVLPRDAAAELAPEALAKEMAPGRALDVDALFEDFLASVAATQAMEGSGDAQGGAAGAMANASPVSELYHRLQCAGRPTDDLQVTFSQGEAPGGTPVFGCVMVLSGDDAARGGTGTTLGDVSGFASKQSAKAAAAVEALAFLDSYPLGGKGASATTKAAAPGVDANEDETLVRRVMPGQIMATYSDLLAAFESLPSEGFTRCRELAARPSWLELRRQPGRKPSKPAARQDPSLALPLPILPPPPPSERMRPIRLRPNEINCRWVRTKRPHRRRDGYKAARASE